MSDIYKKTVNKLMEDKEYSLYEHQKEACKLIDRSKNGSIVIFATSGGKTLVGEYAILESISSGKKAIASFPLRALANEKVTEWKQKYKVQRDTGEDTLNRRKAEFKYEFDLLLSTNERLLSIIESERLRKIVFKDVGIIVIDEIQLIHGSDRGIKLELLLMNIRKFFPQIKIVCLSATFGNYQQFADWLKLTSYKSNFRPLPLIAHSIETPYTTSRYEDTHYKKVLIKEYINSMNIKHPTWQGLVFVSSKKLASELSKLLPNSIDHTASKSSIEKNNIEKAFRNGKISTIVCTPTLAQGVNTPAEYVILADLKRFISNPIKRINEWRFLSHFEYLQMIGRAGRPNLSEEGHYILVGNEDDLKEVNTKFIEREPHVESFLLKEPEWAILLAISKGNRTIKTINDFFKESFAFFQQNNLPNTQLILDVLKPLFIKLEDDKYNLTLTGEKAVLLQISPILFQKTAYRESLEFIYNTMPTKGIDKNVEEEICTNIVQKPINNFNVGLWKFLMSIEGQFDCEPLHDIFMDCPFCYSTRIKLNKTKSIEKGTQIADTFGRFWELMKTTPKFFCYSHRKELESEGKIFLAQLKTGSRNRELAALQLVEQVGAIRSEKFHKYNITIVKLANMTASELLEKNIINGLRMCSTIVVSARQVAKELGYFIPDRKLKNNLLIG